jgi:hypothetical protein
LAGSFDFISRGLGCGMDGRCRNGFRVVELNREYIAASYPLQARPGIPPAVTACLRQGDGYADYL